MAAFLSTSQRSLRDSLKEFLEFKSKTQPKVEFCRDCGSICFYLDFYFCLDDEENGWNIQLPFCPHCNPELARRTAYKA